MERVMGFLGLTTDRSDDYEMVSAYEAAARELDYWAGRANSISAQDASRLRADLAEAVRLLRRADRRLK